ncbi:MAG TPA: tRNA (adenosine(37)-N6)-threonylcarbamoyltransferase complex dimerization subunit type 1 TsaB [Candidatus Saccharimonadales bacterium]|nr:tRNA (adenosine(37)-N6)-threonylcarbamoyltransferase complex dimerization subunit type 1 TsaB [Candidatus Saccharimonadales bacterium]
MIVLLDSSTAICKITLIDGDWRQDYSWQSDRTLAKWLLGYLDKILKENGKTWADISAIGVLEGPGSFTGIRIGLTVMNTIADSQNIPIIGARGRKWQDEVLAKLHAGKNEKIVLPYYDRGANITKPRK